MKFRGIHFINRVGTAEGVRLVPVRSRGHERTPLNRWGASDGSSFSVPRENISLRPLTTCRKELRFVHARLPPRRSGLNPRPGHSGFSHLGILPDDAVSKRAFLEISRYPAPSFWRYSTLTSIILIGSEDLAVKSRPNLFNHFKDYGLNILHSIWLGHTQLGALVTDDQLIMNVVEHSKRVHCHSTLSAPTHTAGFTRRVSRPLVHSHQLHSSAAVVSHLSSIAHCQMAPVKDCRPLGRGSTYVVVGRHPKLSVTRALPRGGPRHRPVSPEHSCVVAKPVGTSSRGEGPRRKQGTEQRDSPTAAVNYSRVSQKGWARGKCQPDERRNEVGQSTTVPGRLLAPGRGVRSNMGEGLRDVVSNKVASWADTRERITRRRESGRESERALFLAGRQAPKTVTVNLSKRFSPFSSAALISRKHHNDTSGLDAIREQAGVQMWIHKFALTDLQSPRSFPSLSGTQNQLPLILDNSGPELLRVMMSCSRGDWLIRSHLSKTSFKDLGSLCCVVLKLLMPKFGVDGPRCGTDREGMSSATLAASLAPLTKCAPRQRSVSYVRDKPRGHNTVYAGAGIVSAAYYEVIPFLTELHVIGAELARACQVKYCPMTNVLQSVLEYNWSCNLFAKKRLNPTKMLKTQIRQNPWLFTYKQIFLRHHPYWLQGVYDRRMLRFQTMCSWPNTESVSANETVDIKPRELNGTDSLICAKSRAWAGSCFSPEIAYAIQIQPPRSFIHNTVENQSYRRVGKYAEATWRGVSFDVSMEQNRNERAGKTGDPRENPLTRGIVQHDSHMPKSGIRFLSLLVHHLIETSQITFDQSRTYKKYKGPHPVPLDLGLNCINSPDARMLKGAAVAERLACSPPTKANRVQSPAVPNPDFRMCESCWTAPLVGGSSRGSPVSPAPSLRPCSMLASTTLTGSQDLAVKSRQNLFTPLLTELIVTRSVTYIYFSTSEQRAACLMILALTIHVKEVHKGPQMRLAKSKTGHWCPVLYSSGYYFHSFATFVDTETEWVK
ncbi:hypothetical protein PR048_027845 [Dryococelus australis]|uniref:Uncharacterized protein n=1 Tax=Dryococelus australis TaxID=614101 RepID=A0ABQ9GHN2_9NEOP|nr:hypothetical protein PR048_027845 [Dryococelus australis]